MSTASQMTATDMEAKFDALLAQMQELASQTEPDTCRRLVDKLHEVGRSLEGPRNYIHRIFFGQCELPCVRIGDDLGLYKVLADSPEPLPVSALAEKTRCDFLVLGRLCRYLASIGVIREMSKDHFTANELTRELTTDGYIGGVRYSHDCVAPVMFDLAQYLRETKFADVGDAGNCPFQITHHTKLELFPWMQQTRPDILGHFNNCMQMFYQGLPTWLDTYPYRETSQNLELGQPLLVDVGGGIGHQCLAFLANMPDAANSVILQDSQQVLDQAIALEGVKKVEYNFFKEQNVRGARMYYFRHILHDWPDDRAVEILRNTAVAMSKDSRVLVDEIVIPDTGAHWSSTALDMTLLATFGSRERTKDQWLNIVAKAGLRLTRIVPYIEVSGHCVLECELSEG